MDAEKIEKKQRRLSKKKNFKQSNEFQYFDKEEEKKIYEKSDRKSLKVTNNHKEKIEVEKNEDMIKRLAEKFDNEEDDNFNCD